MNGAAQLSGPLLLAGLLMTATAPLEAEVPQAREVERWTFEGGIEESEDISGIATRGDFLAIVADEGATLQILERHRSIEGTFVAKDRRTIRLESDDRFEEADLEAAAWGDRHLYLIGSHSRKRKQVELDKSVKKNRERLGTTATEPGRGWLYRLEVGDGGRPRQPESVSLRDELANDPILRPFQVIPSKENGIDIEGLAVGGDGSLYVGFRGPVLRGGYVPVMVITFERKFRQKDLEYEVRYLELGGRGVRGLTRAGDEILVLAGPVGDGPGSYRVYSWNGRDCVPGRDAPEARANALARCDVPLPSPGAKAEGIAFLGRENGLDRFAIVYDSASDGQPTVFTCPAARRGG